MNLFYRLLTYLYHVTNLQLVSRCLDGSKESIQFRSLWQEPLLSIIFRDKHFSHSENLSVITILFFDIITSYWVNVSYWNFCFWQEIVSPSHEAAQQIILNSLLLIITSAKQQHSTGHCSDPDLFWISSYPEIMNTNRVFEGTFASIFRV
jgi:hypothetical protein